MRNQTKAYFVLNTPQFVTEVQLNMADQKINLKDIPLAPSQTLTENDTVLGLVGESAKRIRTSDIKTDLTEVNTAISNLSTEVSGYSSRISSAEGDITNLKSHTSLSNSDVSNTNLNNLLNSVAQKTGYQITPSSQVVQNPSLTYTGYEYTNDNLGSWTVQGIMQNVLGGVPSQIGIGANATYQWSYSSAAAMASQYVLDLKKTQFDNTWTARREYSVGAVVVYNNTLYKCKTANSDANFTVEKWDALSSGSGGGGGTSLTRSTWHTLRNIITEGLSYEMLPASSSYMDEKQDDLENSTDPFNSYWEYEVMFPEIFIRSYDPQYSYFSDTVDYRDLPVWSFEGNTHVDALTYKYGYSDAIYDPQNYSDYDAMSNYYAMGYYNKETGLLSNTGEHFYDNSKHRFKQNLLGMFNDILKRYSLITDIASNQGSDAEDFDLAFNDYVNYVGINPVTSNQYDKTIYAANRTLETIQDAVTGEYRSETEDEALKRYASQTDPIYYEYADFINTLMQSVTTQTIKCIFRSDHQLDQAYLLTENWESSDTDLCDYYYLLEAVTNPKDLGMFIDKATSQMKKIIAFLDEEALKQQYATDPSVFDDYTTYLNYARYIYNNQTLSQDLELITAEYAMIPFLIENHPFITCYFGMNETLLIDIPIILEISPAFLDTSSIGLTKIQERIDDYTPSSSNPIKPRFIFKER